MRRIKPISIYPEPDLRRRLELIADRRKRSLNAQILRFLEQRVERDEARVRCRSGQTRG